MGRQPSCDIALFNITTFLGARTATPALPPRWRPRRAPPATPPPKAWPGGHPEVHHTLVRTHPETGTIGITTYRVGEDKVGVGANEAERECRRIYEKGTGEQLGPKGANDHGLHGAAPDIVLAEVALENTHRFRLRVGGAGGVVDHAATAFTAELGDTPRPDSGRMNPLLRGGGPITAPGSELRESARYGVPQHVSRPSPCRSTTSGALGLS